MDSRRIALVAVLCGAAVSARAATATTTQTVDATVTATIEISIDSATESLTLVPGTTSSSTATLTINSTNPYTIKAAADTHATKGAAATKLFEHNGTAYVTSGRSVATVLQVSGAAGTAAGSGEALSDVTTAGTLIFTGSGAVSGGTVTATISESTPWGTAALPAGSTYRMVITYTATTTAV